MGAFGFQKKQMVGVLGEALDLVFKRRTVPGSDTFDDAAVHGGKMDIFPDDFSTFIGGVDQMTAHVTACRLRHFGRKLFAPEAEFFKFRL